jgi:hypothetical protein
MSADSETALYAPVKAFLARAGFVVKGEVRGCDVVAIHPDEPAHVVVVELKLVLSLDLLLQAADRLAVADEVWLAVPATRRGRDRDRRAVKLCRLIGFGLLAITRSSGHVEVLAEPSSYRPRVNRPKRSRLLREFQRRRGDPVAGGGTGKAIMTAYRQQALDIGRAMHDGPKRPAELRAVAPDAGAILLRNVYGWFERIARGLYGLTPDGQAALERWQPEDELPVS